MSQGTHIIAPDHSKLYVCMVWLPSSFCEGAEGVIGDQLSVNPRTLHCRFGEALEDAHGGEKLTRFEELLEAAVDLDRIPDEYLICANYSADLQVRLLGLYFYTLTPYPHSFGLATPALNYCQHSSRSGRWIRHPEAAGAALGE